MESNQSVDITKRVHHTRGFSELDANMTFVYQGSSPSESEYYYIATINAVGHRKFG